MEPYRDDTDPIAELRAARPAPSEDFAKELDERAAAGFPRRSPRAGSPLGRAIEHLRSLKPRQALIPAGATALAAIAAVTVVVAIGEQGTSAPSAVREQEGSPSSFDGAGPRVQQYGMPAASPPRPEAASGSGISSSAGKAQSAPAPNHLSALAPSGPYASQTRQRDVERSAQIVLATEPADVAKGAGRVFEAVHAHRGIVLNSSVRDGAAGEAGARFELLIPSARLGDALAAFSAIAEVRSRHEATADITAPTVRAGELLRDSRAKIDSLLSELAAADTETERNATEAKLRAERRRSAFLRSQLSSLERRASFSRVSLRIETGAPSAPSGGEDGWGVADALDDAGHILAIAAAVTIVALAVLAPIALIALLAWFANRARLRRARERVLE
jgi:Domain of unknown function (DUF4349)